MKTTPINTRLRNWKLVSGAALTGVCMIAAGCGSQPSPPCVNCGPGSAVGSAPFTLTVNSTDPASTVAITASPADASATTSGTSSFSLSYPADTVVTLTAPPNVPSPAPNAEAGAVELFDHWNGCQSSVATICTVTMKSNATVTAVFRSQVTVSLQASTGLQLQIGTGEQIYLTSQGNNVPDLSVIWTVSDPNGNTDAAHAGTINQTNGFYQSTYPSPAYVTVTATSKYDPVASASIVIQLGAPAVTIGPALTVDTSAVTHTISPNIYGVNQYADGTTLQSELALPMVRWGGDASTRYNYLLDLTNSAGDYYYETNPNTNTAFPDTSDFNTQEAQNQQFKSLSFATVPLIGYTTQSPDSTMRAFACGFSIAKYGAQKGADQYHPDCGNGTLTSNGNPVNSSGSANITVGSGSSAVTVGYGPVQVSDPKDTSVAIDQTFVGNWVKYLVGNFGNAAAGGVQVYELDNEPEYWNGVHQDVHPAWMTFDEVTNKGIAYATAIKTADPTAQVSGPVISNWQNYFFSTADQWAGYENNPYRWNAKPADYYSHGSTPLLAYYLQQMAAAEVSGGTRLLDYLDVHGYFAESAGNALAGDTATQELREDSTRVLWDPTYLDGNYTNPYNTYDGTPMPVQLIPFLKGLVAANYPGTKTALTEYNWGGEESISGAIAQAEVLAIFGWQGLDAAALWSEPLKLDDPTYGPARTAFNFFLNYDGAGSKFGDGSLATNTVLTGVDATGNTVTTYGGSQVAIYAAKRSTDGAITVLLFNKTYQTETTNLVMTTAATSAKVFQYTAANLAAIAPLADAPVTQGTTGGSVALSLPAQSITLLVFPE